MRSAVRAEGDAGPPPRVVLIPTPIIGISARDVKHQVARAALPSERASQACAGGTGPGFRHQRLVCVVPVEIPRFPSSTPGRREIRNTKPSEGSRCSGRWIGERGAWRNPNREPSGDAGVADVTPGGRIWQKPMRPRPALLLRRLPVPPHHGGPEDSVVALVERNRLRIADKVDRITVAEAGQCPAHQFGADTSAPIRRQHLERRDESRQDSIADRRSP